MREIFNGDLPKAFNSLEDFTKYMASFKEAVRIDRKLRSSLSAMLQNIMTTFFEGIRIAVKNKHLKKPYALMMIHRFCMVQKHDGTLGQVFGIEVDLTKVAVGCGLIPEGVEVIHSYEDHPQGEFGIGLAVPQNYPKEEVDKILKDFEELGDFKLEFPSDKQNKGAVA